MKIYNHSFKQGLKQNISSTQKGRLSVTYLSDTDAKDQVALQALIEDLCHDFSVLPSGGLDLHGRAGSKEVYQVNHPASSSSSSSSEA